MSAQATNSGRPADSLCIRPEGHTLRHAPLGADRALTCPDGADLP
jgi:hypothetical protein